MALDHAGTKGVTATTLHDAMAAVYGRFAGVDVPGAYLRRAVVNAARSWQRDERRRRVARYREMKFMLMDSRNQVKFCETWNSLERVVLKTERALLQEVLEWHSITSFSESH